MAEPTISLRRHRYVASVEHDPEHSLFDGCCAVCVEPWPCGHERELAAAELAALARFTTEEGTSDG